MAALRAHATQITIDGPFFALSNNVGNEVWGIEFYRIAKGERGALDEDGLETDLFAGLAAEAATRARRRRCCWPARSPGSRPSRCTSCWWGLVLAAAAVAARPWSRCRAGWWTRLAFVVGLVALVGWLTRAARRGRLPGRQDCQGYALLGLGCAAGARRDRDAAPRSTRPATRPGSLGLIAA